jgi:hypothetical protein
MVRRAKGATAVVSSILVVAAVTATGGPSQAASLRTSAALAAVMSRSAAVAAHAVLGRPELPLGGTTIFPRYQLLAYYGTAHTAALGVLGEGTIPRMTQRLRDAARPYRASGKPVQIVYELIVSVADAHPGRDGNYSHYIPREYVQQFIHAARRNKALLVLDLQPGRQSFLTQARHFRWALREPFVGLALDPEWRMGPGQVPAQQIGHVGAAEINHTSRVVADVVRNNHLPQKIFMVHQFRREMVVNIQNVRGRSGLAMVQHVDGFGTRRQKLATYHRVAEPRQFRMGFKLFYDEDTRMFRPREALAIRPRISFFSYQ